METTPRSEYTPEKVAELIVEGKRRFTNIDITQSPRQTKAFIRSLAHALEATSAERDEALDVIRSIRLYCENQGDKFRYHAGEILSRIPEHPKED